MQTPTILYQLPHFNVSGAIIKAKLHLEFGGGTVAIKFHS
jgi:hypothetical protein